MIDQPYANMQTVGKLRCPEQLARYPKYPQMPLQLKLNTPVCTVSGLLIQTWWVFVRFRVFLQGQEEVQGWGAGGEGAEPERNFAEILDVDF